MCKFLTLYNSPLTSFLFPHCISKLLEFLSIYQCLAERSRIFMRMPVQCFLFYTKSEKKLEQMAHFPPCALCYSKPSETSPSFPRSLSWGRRKQSLELFQKITTGT